MTYPLSFMTKRGSSFGLESSLVCLRDVVRFTCIFFFLFLHYPLVHQSCDHLFTYIVLYFHIYDDDDDVCFSSPTSTCVVSFLSLYTCFFVYAIFISVSHMMP